MHPRIAEFVSERELIDWTRRFVRYPSQQTDLLEAEPEVLGFIDECVAPLAAELGLPCRKDPMGNLLIELGSGPAERGVLFMAYAMTHPAASMTDPFAAELADGAEGRFVRGRGVSEQKGALAAALAAIAAAARADLPGRLILSVCTAGETGRHDAVASVFDALDAIPRFGVVVIGTDGKVALGNKGRIDVNVTVGGKAAHSSMPWTGVDAIAGARRVLDQIAAIHIDGGDHPDFGRATLTVTSIRSGPRATHTVQNEVRLTLDRRLLPGQDPDSALDRIRAGLDLPAPWSLAVERGAFQHPCEITADGALIARVRAGCQRMGLGPPETFYSHGALDAGYMTLRGCETAMWGPGSQRFWHADDERVAVADLARGATAYYGLIEACLT